ncbi:Zn(2)-C6 fungal-type DNA-binding domain [Lasallia pustulata]|uniref:Zn(2)-C6 fungal-type DNA-binding domain n=1 Tax=Lasallia pustulata TaxID=136370 RepID=A0A1W5DCW5_9LECA|nr:Zn(2)-C6 fungal-type DNA-binding domain [Lasallia pustulata]
MSDYYIPNHLANLDKSNVPSHVHDQGSTVTESPQLSAQSLGRWFDMDSDQAIGAANLPGKCDEHRPVCERCKKGTRDCVYPEPPSSGKSAGGSKLGQHRVPKPEDGSSSGEYTDEEIEAVPPPENQQLRKKSQQSPLSNVRKKAASTTRNPSHQAAERRLPMTGPTTHRQEKSMSPLTDTSSQQSSSRSASAAFKNPGTRSSISTNTSRESTPWSHLPPDLQYYLDYHQSHLTYQYYFFKNNADQFLHTVFLDHALSYEPLLYAVVGFAAFRLTLKNSQGKIQDFLQYYYKSVSLLRKSLQSGQKHTDSTILTILQLAAFEEYLGDWANLLGHQKAAQEMLLELYTPETIMETEVRRKILCWYARFDVYAGLMSGHGTVLSREWIHAYEQYYVHQWLQSPDDIDCHIEAAIAMTALNATDMTLLFAKLPRGEISVPNFMKENQDLSDRIRRWRKDVEPLLSRSEYLVSSFEGARPRDPDDIVDPYIPGTMYEGPLWTVNYMLLAWYALDLMHKYQTALMLQQQPPADLANLALEQCRLFEAIEYWPGSPPGSMLVAGSSVAMASLFLPKDEKHSMWCRRKFAMIENMGYIYPPTFRKKMAELWDVQEINQWWLPNGEGYSPIIRSIRDFIEDRTVKPRDQDGEDLREIKGILSKLAIDDSPRDSPESSSSIAGGVYVDYRHTNPEDTLLDFPKEAGYNMGEEFDESIFIENAADLWSIDEMGEMGSGFYHPAQDQ